MHKVTQPYYSFMTQYGGIKALYTAVCDPNFEIVHRYDEDRDVSRMRYAEDGTLVYIPAMYKAAPVMCFMHLESILEDFLLQTLMTLYARSPESIPERRDGSVKYSDVISARRDGEDLMDRILYEAVRGVPRSLEAMIGELGQFDLRFDEPSLALPYFIELGAARNLWAHNGGRVDRDYLTKTRDYWRMVDREPPSEGNEREITRRYVLNAMNRAVILVQETEEHMSEHYPEACVRAVRNIEKLGQHPYDHIYGLSRKLEDALRTIAIVENPRVHVGVTNIVDFPIRGVANVDIYISVRMPSGDLSDHAEIGKMLKKLSERIDKFLADSQVPYRIEYIEVKFRGVVLRDGEWVDARQWGQFEPAEIAAAQERGLEGAKLLDALGFEDITTASEDAIPF